MNESKEIESVIIIPCSKCGAFNRATVTIKVEEAKTIAEEQLRKKLEEDANHDRETNNRETEGECVRPSDPEGKPAEGSTDNSASDSTGTKSNSKGKEGKSK